MDGNADRAEIDEDDNGTSDIMAYDNDQDGNWIDMKKYLKIFTALSFTIYCKFNLRILFSKSVIASKYLFSKADILPLSPFGSSF